MRQLDRFVIQLCGFFTHEWKHWGHDPAEPWRNLV